MDGSQDGMQVLSDADKMELQTFIQKSQSQLTINEVVGQLTQSCFEKCVKDPITPGRLEKTQETCAANCVSRWFDSQNAVLKAIESQRRTSI